MCKASGYPSDTGHITSFVWGGGAGREGVITPLLQERSLMLSVLNLPEVALLAPGQSAPLSDISVCRLDRWDSGKASARVLVELQAIGSPRVRHG